MSGRLVVVSGPSGVGKGPIIEWLKRLYYPEMLAGIDIPELGEMKGRKSLTERHTGLEGDIGFEGMGPNRHEYLCRGSLHAIDLDLFDRTLAAHDAVIFETYHTNLGFVRQRYGALAEVESVFISPLPQEEISRMAEMGKGLEDYLPDIMLHALILRALGENKKLTRPLIRELETRAEDALAEMRSAEGYDVIIPNRCYECDSRWKASILDDEPRQAVEALHGIILGRYPAAH